MKPGNSWYDADTLILNHEIPWELFLPQGNSFSDIHLIATKNLDGFNAGILIMRIHQWTVEFLADAYALPRLRPEVDLVGNVDQNALRWTSNREEYKSHVLFQPQNWYNGFQGPKGYETEIVKGDMLVHFAGINQDYNEEIKKTIMDEWFGKMKNQTQAWQVPIEQTRYPNEINDFWAVLKDARELLSTVDVRIDTSDPINAAVIAARDELKWAIEEEAFDTARVRKTASDMIQALEVAKNQQQPIPPVVDAQGDAADGGAPRAADAQAATAGQNDGSEQLQQ